MTWWVINCPGAAQSPVPGSLFLLYDKKERRSSEAVCINNRGRISSLLRKILLSHSFQNWRGLFHSRNSHLFPEPSDVISANYSSRELGKFWRGLPSRSPQAQEQHGTATWPFLELAHTDGLLGGSSGLWEWEAVGKLINLDWMNAMRKDSTIGGKLRTHKGSSFWHLS